MSPEPMGEKKKKKKRRIGNFVCQYKRVISSKDSNVCDNLLGSGGYAHVCVNNNLHTHLFMQFLGVYIKAHISLSDHCYTVIKTFL